MKNVHVFHGVDGKAGTTMISQSLAEYLSKNMKESRIMMLSLHGRLGTEYVDRVSESIEGLKLHLSNEMLDLERLLQESRITDNFYQLGGVASIDRVRAFRPSMCHYLLETIAPAFNLIIVDAGNDIDNPLALGALEATRNIYCVISQQESNLKRYELLKPMYKRLELDFPIFVLNKYKNSDPRSLAYVEKRLGGEKAVVKVEMSDYERLAETERKTLLNYGENGFTKSIGVLANTVLENSQIPMIPVERKRKWKPFL